MRKGGLNQRREGRAGEGARLRPAAGFAPARPQRGRAGVRLLAALLFFALAATPARASDPLVFAVMGDTGTGGRAQMAVAEQMKEQWERRRFEFVITVGDNIYPDGDPALLKPRFEDPYRPLLDAGVKFYASLGNHDVEDSQARAAQTNYEHFNMGGRSYYSFEKGKSFWDKVTGGGPMVEFFALDTTRMDDEQLAWIEKELAGSKARWKVVYMHHPLYSSAGRHGSHKKFRALLEPVFVRHKVDVVFAGHDHVYERTKPQKGIVHYVAGAGGKLRKGDLDRGTAFFAEGNDDVNSFLVVSVTDEEMRVEAIATDGRVLDHSFIAKAKDADAKSAAAGAR
jgi:predicted phosphodiesterase